MGEGRKGKCYLNYPAHVSAAHGLDKVKVSPVISDLVIDEDLFLPADDVPHLGSVEWKHDSA